jgi:hypothetical protein
MPKLDKQDLIRLYSASPQEPTFVNAPRLHFLMLDGQGDPRRTPPAKWQTIIRQPVTLEVMK